MFYFLVYQSLPFALINVLIYLALLALSDVYIFVATGSARPRALGAWLAVPANRTRVMCNIAVIVTAAYFATQVGA